MSGCVSALQGKPPDWQDFIGIICLLVINSTISFIEENNAGNAAAALMARLAPKTKVLRDGQWGERDAVILVPGDIVSIKLGDIIPADARLLEGDPLKIDQVGIDHCWTGMFFGYRTGTRMQMLNRIQYYHTGIGMERVSKSSTHITRFHDELLKDSYLWNSKFEG